MSPKLVLLDQIPKDQAALFAEVIVLTVSKTPYSARTERLEQIFDKLDRSLLRPSFTSRLFSGGSSKYNRPCSSHKPLNANVVHSLFMLLSKEVKLYSKILRQEWSRSVTAEIPESTILSLNQLHRLLRSSGTTAETLRNTSAYLLAPWVGTSHCEMQHLERSLCEACAISHVVSNVEMLLQLWTSVRCRGPNPQDHKTKYKIPQFSKWLRLWMDMYIHRMAKIGQKEAAQNLVRTAEDHAKCLKILRKSHKNEKYGWRPPQVLSTHRPLALPPSDCIPTTKDISEDSRERLYAGTQYDNITTVGRSMFVPLLLDTTFEQEWDVGDRTNHNQQPEVSPTPSIDLRPKLSGATSQRKEQARQLGIRVITGLDKDSPPIPSNEPQNRNQLPEGHSLRMYGDVKDQIMVPRAPALRSALPSHTYSSRMTVRSIWTDISVPATYI